MDDLIADDLIADDDDFFLVCNIFGEDKDALADDDDSDDSGNDSDDDSDDNDGNESS
jgi:hypothetical protein